VRLEAAVFPLAKTRRDVGEGWAPVGDGASFRLRGPLGGHAASVLGDGAEQGSREPLPRAAVRDLADVDGEDRATRALDPLDDLGLDAERADEPVEVRDHDDVGIAGLDHLDRAAKAGTLLERGAAGDVELFQCLDEVKAVTLAGCRDTLTLFTRRDKAVAVTIADARDAHDADCTTRGGRLGQRGRTRT
jgi:hypothetical protein